MRSEAQPRVILLGKPSDKADRRDKPPSLQVAAKCGVCVVALLGIVVLATTFVARLASIRILPATQSVEDLIRGSLMLLMNRAALEDIACATIRAQRFAGFLYWQKHARMSVPQQL